MAKRSVKIQPNTTNTIDPAEIAKFEAMAADWWNPKGKFKPLHQFNPVRIEFLRDTILAHIGTDNKKRSAREPLKGLKLLDIGCGGGLISEPMCRLGAAVTGLDASEKNIKIAALHAEKEGLEIAYRAESAEAHSIHYKEKYDVVLALEIIEHVADVSEFVKHCAKLVKPGGLLFIATLNRTAKSLVLAKFAAEYVLQWLPKGTHDWRKFLRPSEVESEATKHGMQRLALAGFSFNPLFQNWKLSSDVSMNYMLAFIKN